MSTAVQRWSARVALVAVPAALALACDGGTGAASSATPSPERGGDCATCHMPDYQHAEPVHVAEKPTTCKVCHGQDAWKPSALHHDFSPLKGAHAKAPCSWCHKGTPSALAVFKGTATACVKCHLEDYEASTFPGHASFATTCTDCHDNNAWRPATFTPPPIVPPRPLTPSLPLVPGKAPLKGAPASKTNPGARPAAAPLPTSAPAPPPAAPRPTTRPPDVISRPSRRR